MSALAFAIACLIGLICGGLLIFVGMDGGPGSDLQIGFGALLLVSGFRALGEAVEAADRGREAEEDDPAGS